MAHRDIETAELSAGTSRFDDEEPAGGDNRFATQFLRLKAAAPVILALEECDAELRTEAIELFKQLEREELEEEQRFATLALLSEMLFSDLDEKELPGVDVAEAEAATASRIPLLGLMDEAEAVFAERVRDLMEAKGLTQAELAAKVGIGQPAVSMMLNRSCRPQRKTVLRFAEALEVSPELLWPASSATGDFRELLGWHARRATGSEKALSEEEQQQAGRPS